MDIKANIEQSETKQFKVIFPDTLNVNETLFGGTALQWMDEVAYITATRFCRQKMVTVSTNNIQFLQPIPFGTITEITGRVVNVGRVKLVIQIDIFVEQMYSHSRIKAIEGQFTFAAVNNNNKPTCLFDC